jgi:hypothetical protein
VCGLTLTQKWKGGSEVDRKRKEVRNDQEGRKESGGQLGNRLVWYSAMMAGAFLVPASPANAGVRWSGPVNVMVDPGNPSFLIDLDGDGPPDFEIRCYGYPFGYGGCNVLDMASMQNVRATYYPTPLPILSWVAFNYSSSASLGSAPPQMWQNAGLLHNTSVDYSYNPISYVGNFSPFIPPGPVGFIPVKLGKPDGTHYGWIHYEGAGPRMGMIHSWAYETLPNVPIHAVASPTAIDLISFTGRALPGSVFMEWETATEIDNAGFYIWRSENRDWGYERVTGEMIFAQGSATSGASYAWQDTTVNTGTTYYYKLEDIDTTGSSTLHDPVTVVVPAAIELISPEDGAGLSRRSALLFKWNTDDYRRFQLQFSTDEGFNGDVLTLPLQAKNKLQARWIGKEFYKPKAREYRQLKKLGRQADTLFWRVVAKDGTEVDASTASALDVSR